MFLKCNYDPIIQISTSGILQAKPPSSVPLGNGMLIGLHFFPIRGQIARHLGKERYREASVLLFRLSQERPRGCRAPRRAPTSRTDSPEKRAFKTETSRGLQKNSASRLPLKSTKKEAKLDRIFALVLAF